METPKFKKNISVVSNFTMSLVAGLIATFAMVIYISLALSAQKTSEETRINADENLSTLINSLKKPMWDFNTEAIRLIGAAFASNDFIGDIQIEDNTGQVVFLEKKPGIKPDLTRRGEIVYNDEKIGSVYFSVSSDYHSQLEGRYMWYYVASGSIMLAATVLFSLVTLRYFLKKPLRQFTGLVHDFSEGNHHAFENDRTYLEFQPLIGVLKEMGAVISAQFNELQQGKEILEDRVQERTVRLRDALELNERILTASVTGISVYEEDGQCVMANEAVGRIIGATSEQVLAQNFRRIESWGSNGLLSAAEETLKTGHPRALEAHLNSSFGKELWLECFFTSFTRSGKKHLLLMLNDITSRKKTEQKLAAMSDEMARQQKMATIGQLTATVSHELRNPLATIANTVSVMKIRLSETGDTFLPPLERIERNVVRCDNIITDLLDFSRTRPAMPENISVDKWLTELVKESELPGWLEVALDLNTEGTVIFRDLDRLRRVVINLLENAVQAMEQTREKTGGDQNRLRVGSRLNADRLEILIEDTGPGMTEEVLSRIFEPLFSTKTYGVGLGLPTVRQILEQENGGIDITSNPGAGTTVAIWIPLDMHQSRERTG
ncbi:MAG: ATP-binding protein [Deltaproteobacteria bacterium]|nr:ATP-binding protein [Deltaproteobacteria bacterium]